MNSPCGKAEPIPMHCVSQRFCTTSLNRDYSSCGVMKLDAWATQCQRFIAKKAWAKMDEYLSLLLEQSNSWSSESKYHWVDPLQVGGHLLGHSETQESGTDGSLGKSSKALLMSSKTTSQCVVMSQILTKKWTGPMLIGAKPLAAELASLQSSHLILGCHMFTPPKCWGHCP